VFFWKFSEFCFVISSLFNFYWQARAFLIPCRGHTVGCVPANMLGCVPAKTWSWDFRGTDMMLCWLILIRFATTYLYTLWAIARIWYLEYCSAGCWSYGTKLIVFSSEFFTSYSIYLSQVIEVQKSFIARNMHQNNYKLFLYNKYKVRQMPLSMAVYFYFESTIASLKKIRSIISIVCKILCRNKKKQFRL
jgi:hypothetical protein